MASTCRSSNYFLAENIIPENEKNFAQNIEGKVFCPLTTLTKNARRRRNRKIRQTLGIPIPIRFIPDPNKSKAGRKRWKYNQRMKLKRNERKRLESEVHMDCRGTKVDQGRIII